MKKVYTFIIVLMVLTACTVPQGKTPEPAATNESPANMPNPASVHCVQNGNKHEIITAADGSQSGVCVFPDGSTCDEWAFYRGECGPEAKASPTPASTVEATPEADDGKPGENASGGYMPPGTSEEIADWRGVINSTQSGAQYDDFFELWTNGQVIYFGIDSQDPAIKSQIEALRDSGKVVHLFGALISNVPDYNGSQIQVTRIKVD